MSELARGTRVTLTLGTKIGLYSEERTEAGFRKVMWNVIDASMGEDEIPFTVDRVGVSHATLGGGGRDYYLRDDAGFEATVRTTFSRPESATFRVL